MILLFVLAISIVFSIKNINEPYNTNSIVLLGISSALVGIFGTYIGVNSAFSAVPNIANISPTILINGLKHHLLHHLQGELLCFFQPFCGIFL